MKKLFQILVLLVLHISFANAGICNGKDVVSEDHATIVIETFLNAIKYVDFRAINNKNSDQLEAIEILETTLKNDSEYVVSVCTEDTGLAYRLYYIEILSSNKDNEKFCGIHLKTTKPKALNLPKIYDVVGFGCAG